MAIFMDPNYNKGFNDGTKYGAKLAKKAVAEDFVVRLTELRNQKGIGPKTWDKIMDCLDITKEEKSWQKNKK